MTGNAGSLRRWLFTAAVAALVASSCGSDGTNGANASGEDPVVLDSDDADNRASGDSGGTIDDAPPPGQATASVDGLNFTFELPGGLDCMIAKDSLTYSYRIGDNEATLGAGANLYDDGWLGNIILTVANPEGEQGPIGYYPKTSDAGLVDTALLTIDGDSAMYIGPMMKQPANDGSLPAPVEVGTGTIMATC